MPQPIVINPLQRGRRFGAFKGQGAEGFPAPGPIPATGDMLSAARDFRQAVMQQQLLGIEQKKLELDEARHGLDAEHLGMQNALLAEQIDAARRTKPTDEEVNLRNTEAKIKQSPESQKAMQEGLVGEGKRPGAQADLATASAEKFRSEIANVATENALKQEDNQIRRDVLNQSKRAVEEKRLDDATTLYRDSEPGSFGRLTALEQLKAMKDSPVAQSLAKLGENGTFVSEWRPRDMGEEEANSLKHWDDVARKAIGRDGFTQADYENARRYRTGVALKEAELELKAEKERLSGPPEIDAQNNIIPRKPNIEPILQKLVEARDASARAATAAGGKTSVGVTSKTSLEVTNLNLIQRPDLAKQVQAGKMTPDEAFKQLTAEEFGMLTAANTKGTPGEKAAAGAVATGRAKQAKAGEDAVTIDALLRAEFGSKAKRSLDMGGLTSGDVLQALSNAKTRDGFVALYKKWRLRPGFKAYWSEPKREAFETKLVTMGWLSKDDLRVAGGLEE